MSDFGQGRQIVGRKHHKCTGCGAPIPKGEPHYQYKGMYDGEWQNWRMHDECIVAFRAGDDDEFMPGEFEVPERVQLIERERTV